jgi:rubrerythrin
LSDPLTNNSPNLDQENGISEDSNSRRKFFKTAGVVGGGGVIAALVAACGGSNKASTTGSTNSTTVGSGTTTAGTTSTPTTTTHPAKASDVKSDLVILNYALTLEYLESDFYDKVIASHVLNAKEQELAKNFGAAEHAHVAALTSAITKFGGKPVKSPKFKFPEGNRLATLTLASTVENLGSSAYLGQAPRIANPEVLAAALSIHSVEARHAAALNYLLGKSPTPTGAFAAPANMATVLKDVTPFIVS